MSVIQHLDIAINRYGLLIFITTMNVQHELVNHNLYNAMTSMLHEPLGKLDENKVVGELHVKQELVEGTTDIMAYHGWTIKQEEVDIKEEFLVSCAASGNFSEEASVPTVCEYEAEVKDMGTHSGEKPYSCSICEYKAAGKSNLVKHLMTHIVEKRYSCSICEYKATKKGHLVRHMRTHTGQKPYSCSVCGYTESAKVRLVTHMRNHTEEKPYWCSTCEYKATQKSHLVEHMRTHTGERPYSCDVCEYKAARKRRLVSHMKMHTAGNR